MKTQTIIIALSGLLFASLSANMYMAGLMVGKATTMKTARSLIDHSYDQGMTQNHAALSAMEEAPQPGSWRAHNEALRKELSPEDRAVVTDIFKQNKDQIMTLRREMRDAREQVSTLMQTDDPDPVALDAALRLEKEKKMETWQLIQKIRQQADGQVSPDGRATLEKSRLLRRNMHRRRDAGETGQRQDWLQERRRRADQHQRLDQYQGQRPDQRHDQHPDQQQDQRQNDRQPLDQGQRLDQDQNPGQDHSLNQGQRLDQDSFLERRRARRRQMLQQKGHRDQPRIQRRQQTDR